MGFYLRKTAFLLASVFVFMLAQGCEVHHGFHDEDDSLDLFVPGDFNTIQEAIDFAIPGDRVLVFSGTYSPATNGERFPIFLKDGVEVLGEIPETTLLDARGTGRVMNALSYNDGVVAGFTMVGGRAARGGALLIERSAGLFQNLYLLQNEASELGTGLFVVNCQDLLVRNLVISQNFRSAESSLDPAQVHIENSDILFENNVVALGDLDGMRMDLNSTGEYQNNIFYQNGSGGFGVGFADLGVPPTALIQYNLFFDNVEADFFIDDALRTAEEANNLSPDDGVAANFNADPLFVDPTSNIFTLSGASPAFNAGNPDAVFDNPDGSRNDIGAFGGPAAILP